MFIRVQRTCPLLFLTAILCLIACPRLAVSSNVEIVPLIGEPQESVYSARVRDALERAEDSIEILLSSASLNDVPFYELLADAAARSVTVRVLLDASDWAPAISEKNRPIVDWLRERGVDARLDDPEITLHAKLIIIDTHTVILGSSNWNAYALTEHWQADVLIRSPSIGDFYRAYFERLWLGELHDYTVEFDAVLPMDGVPTVLPLADIPDSRTYADTVLSLLGSAQRSIHVMMYRISAYASYPGSIANLLLDAVTEAAQRGLEVKVLMDDCAFYPDSADANLASAILLFQRGVDVRLDHPGETTHAKLVIVDGRSLVLGSTNWNYYSLEKNCETNMLFANLAEVAELYEALFQRRWDAARTLTEVGESG